MEQTVKCMRSPEIDIAKGIGILLVVLGHAVPDANTGIQNMFWAVVFNWIFTWRCLWQWQAFCFSEKR